MLTVSRPLPFTVNMIAAAASDIADTCLFRLNIVLVCLLREADNMHPPMTTMLPHCTQCTDYGVSPMRRAPKWYI